MLLSRSRLLAIAMTLVACTSERRARGDASAFSPDPCGVDGVDGCWPYDDEQPPLLELNVIEIEDDPNNSTLDPCDTGTIKSPGADIDAAELNSGVYLSRCQLTKTNACENDSLAASQAERAPDATGPEETGTYASLSGGVLRCTWDNDADVTSSDDITVIEIEVTGDTTVEQYRVRLCDSLSGECQRNSAYASGDVWFSGPDLF